MKYSYLSVICLFTFSMSFGQVPVITSFIPVSGPVGTTVTINGANFNPAATSNIVYFGAVKALVNSASTTALNVTVPTGASYQPITVYVNGLTAHSIFPFSVTFGGGNGGFVTTAYTGRQDITTTDKPRGQALFDIDGDGKTDLICSNIFRNTTVNNVPSFSIVPNMKRLDDAGCVAVGDIDGDGKLDMAHTKVNYGNAFYSRNKSAPGNFTLTFELPMVLRASANATGIIINDFDNDGKNEVAISSSDDSSFYIVPNNHDTANFIVGTAIRLTSANKPLDIAAADFDSDGKVDIALLNNQNSISVHKNNSVLGSFVFAAGINYGASINARKILIADVDRDGKTDIIVKSLDTFSVFRNTGTMSIISFAPAVKFFIANSSHKPAIADADGDGLVDIAVAWDKSIIIYRNASSPGNIVFESGSAFILGQTVFTTAFGDFTGDGKPDLATTFLPTASSTNNIAILRNKINEPHIASITPTDATPGSTVTIKGRKFTGTASVFFGNVPPASFTVLSDTAISCVLTNNPSGMVKVITQYGTDSLPGFIRIDHPAPVISSFTPLSAPIGAIVTINGSNFVSSASGNIVYFGSVKAIVTAATATSLTVTVPAGAGYQPLMVVSNGLTARSVLSFTITFNGAVLPMRENTFSHTIPFRYPGGTTFSASNIALMDFNGDGRNDLLRHKGSFVDIHKNITDSGIIKFDKRTFLSVAANDNEVATGDINGDGKMDIISASTTRDNDINVRLNTSTIDSIKFANTVKAAIDTTIAGAYVLKDIDGDGKDDFIAVNMGYSISVQQNICIYRNKTSNGVISFGDKLVLPTGTGEMKLTVSDLDSDNRPDIIISNYAANNISIYRNTSAVASVSFTFAGNFATSGPPGKISVADIDGDQKNDLIVTANNSLLVLGNTSSTGSISFSNSVTIANGAQNFIMNDFDGDGRVDIWYDDSYNFSILMNNSAAGNINFSLVSPYSPQVNFSETATGDLDGDGDPDIITDFLSIFDTDRVFDIIKNDITVPLSFYTPPSIHSFTPLSGSVGSSVTITGTNFGSGISSNSVYFGNTSAVITSASPTTITAIVPANANYQHISVRRDSLYGYSSLPFNVTFSAGFPGLGNNLFEQPIDSFAEGIRTLVMSDLDGDGAAEIITGTSSGISIYQNTGTNGQILLGSKTDIPGTSSGISIKDMDGDGKPDIINKDNGQAIFKNTSMPGNISFTAYPVSFTPGIPADIDKDGRPDLLFNNGSVTLNQFVNAAYLFSPATGSTGISFQLVKEMDFDGDGKIDFAGINTTNNRLYVYRNTSTTSSNSFSQQGTYYSLLNMASDIEAGDFDNDQKPDIIVSNLNDSSISVFKNTSGGGISFAARTDVRTGPNPVNVSVMDMNGDDKVDMAVVCGVSGAPGYVSLFRNISSGAVIRFDTAASYYPVDAAGVVSGDLNNDGQPDMVVYGTSSFSIFKNQVNRPVILSFTPAAGTVGTTVTIKGFNFSGSTSVSFGAVAAASFTVVSDTVITAVAGEGATGAVAVTRAGITTSVNGYSMLAPVITSFSPAAGLVGSTVTITGANFSPVAASNVVYFGSVKAPVVSASATSIQVKVPAGASYIPVSVTVFGYSAYATKPFNVVFPPVSGAVIDQRSFGNRIDSMSFYSSLATVAADFDGDGKADIVHTDRNSITDTNALIIYRNTSAEGNILLETKKVFIVSRKVKKIEVADMNSDGKLDVVFLGEYGGVYICINNSVLGNISFEQPVLFGEMMDRSGLAIGDINGDGKPDIATVVETLPMFQTFINTSKNGMLSFRYSSVCCAGFSVSSDIRLADIDGDSRQDVIITENSRSWIAVFRNLTVSPDTVIFSPKTVFQTGTGIFPMHLAVADFDADDKLDIAVSTNQNLILFKNFSTPGNISFENNYSYSAVTMAGRELRVANLNGDDKPDIITGDVYLFKNNSSAGSGFTFSTPVRYPGLFSSNTAACDLNGDGKPELINGNVKILQNLIGNTAELCPPSGNAQLDCGVAGLLFQWQQSTDSSNFINISNGTNFNGVTSNTLQLINIPAVWSGRQFRCITDGIAGNPVTIQFINRWTGSAGNTWENVANWSCGVLPDSNTDVIIQSGTVVINSNVIVRSLSLSQNASLVVSSGFTLTVLR